MTCRASVSGSSRRGPCRGSALRLAAPPCPATPCPRHVLTYCSPPPPRCHRAATPPRRHRHGATGCLAGRMARTTTDSRDTRGTRRTPEPGSLESFMPTSAAALRDGSAHMRGAARCRESLIGHTPPRRPASWFRWFSGFLLSAAGGARGLLGAVETSPNVPLRREPR